jgi:hypothetical protein
MQDYLLLNTPAFSGRTVVDNPNPSPTGIKGSTFITFENPLLDLPNFTPLPNHFCGKGKFNSSPT